MGSDRLANGLIGVLTVCVLTMTALVVRRELRRPTLAGAPRSTVVADWLTYVAGGHIIGPTEAPVTIIEFADFQCPHCQHLARILRDLRQEYPKEIRVVYRNYPLSGLHPFALEAALAAECAGLQGRFDAYHDVLFEWQDSIGTVRWDVFARHAGVPRIAAFAKCIRDRTTAHRVEADVAAGERLGVTSTPTVVVNGLELLGGTPSLAFLDTIVGTAIRGRVAVSEGP